MERGEQRARLDLERALGGLKDALGDGDAVQRLQFERSKNEQVQGAFDGAGTGSVTTRTPL